MLYKNAVIFTDAGHFVHGSLRVEDGRFTQILDFVPSEAGIDLDGALVIPGLVDIKVNVEKRLDSSNADLMLDSTFENEEALKVYAKHPEHVAVADSKVRPFTALRSCLDFEI